MRNYLLLLIVLLTTSCATYQLQTSYEPIYDSNGNAIDVTVIENEWELNRLLRNDFQFRYNFAQYNITQNSFFHYNRMFGMNRFSWNRSQMWNDWVWGYPYGNGIGWSYSWNNNSWSSNSWNNWGSPFGNNTGWNGWSSGYGYNAWHQIYGRRMSIQNRRGIASMGNSRIARETTSVIHGNNNTRVRVKRTNNTIVNVVKPPKPIRTNIPVYNNPNRVIINNNSRPSYNNNSKPIRNNNSRPSNNRGSSSVKIKRGGN